MKKFLLVGVAILALTLVLTCCVTQPGTEGEDDRDEATNAVPSPTLTIVPIEAVPTVDLGFDLRDEAVETGTAANPTTQPILNRYDIPKKNINHPSGYPKELRFPEEFALVEVSSGAMPMEGVIGWSLHYRYNGTFDVAASLIATFFISKGWDVQRFDNSAESYMLFVKSPNTLINGTVLFELDSNDSDSVLVNFIYGSQKPDNDQ